MHLGESRERPRLYITLANGLLTIRKAKNWADPTKNPNGLAIKHKIVGDSQLVIIRDWCYPNE